MHRSGLLILLCIVVSTSAWAHDEHLWRLVASSDYVVQGFLNLRTDVKGRPVATQNEFDNVRLSRTTFLKGKPTASTESVTNQPQDATIHFLMEYSSQQRLETMARLNRSRVVVFLVSTGHPKALYLSGSRYDGIVSSSPSLESKLAAEIAEQARLINQFPSSTFTKPDEYDQIVRDLISNCLKKETERKAFEHLEALGSKAVPSMIRQMDDHRALPIKNISLRNNFPQAFEAMRHYGVSDVFQALAAILNQITWESFGHPESDLFEGTDPLADKRILDGWRLYLMHGMPR
jgi:hypothetical protein